MYSALRGGATVALRASLPWEGLARSGLMVSITVLGLLSGSLLCLAEPAWDDFVRATGPAQGGWWHYVFGLVYFHWQGRWASCGLESAVLPKVEMTRCYPMLIGAVAFVNAAGAYALCRWFTPKSPRSTSLALTACLLALLWAGMPSLAETVYWFVGAVENAMVLSLACMLVIALIGLSTSSRAKPVLATFGVAVLCAAAVTICGFHELYGAMLCLALATGCLWACCNPSVNRAAWIAVTVSAAAGLAIVVMAPGNAHRLDVDGGSHGRHLAYDLGVAGAQILGFVPRWLFNPRLLAASVWVACSPMFANQHRIETDRVSAFSWKWVMPILWLTMLAMGFFAPSWAFGARMPARTLSGVYVVFVVGWLINVYVWSSSSWIHRLRISNSNSVIRRAACLTVAITLLGIGNASAAIADLYDRVGPWNTAVQRRFALLRLQAGGDAVVPELPTRYPTLLLNGEVDSNPGDYRNWSMVSFFKLRSLRIIPASGPMPAAPRCATHPPGGGAGQT